MATKTLAVTYRPTKFEDVVEQDSVKIILQQQLESGEIKNAYLFTGPAGCGKTTLARIFANEINKGQGNPIEMDAASNSGVDDVRKVGEQARTKSLDSEYKCFIIDECHSISQTGWQAFLKLIEEPPLKTIFLFCTTNPEKIPKTILSRVQRYDIHKISQDGIVIRLAQILDFEDPKHVKQKKVQNWRPALDYIAKISEGGMRDAISLMEKALAYNSELTIENVVAALGTVDYDVMLKLTDYFLDGDVQHAMEVIEQIHADGKDIKQFVKQYTHFLLDIQKWDSGCDWQYLQIPKLKVHVEWMENLQTADMLMIFALLQEMVALNSKIKYSSSPKYDLQASLLLLTKEES